jgi:release factor H-coupled RctB family protein
MPSRPLTIVLNSNNSQKATILFPSDSPDPREWILKEARNKLRIRALKRVFLRGGTELEQSAVLDSDVTDVWVSKGEEYIGPTAKQTPGSSLGAEAAVRVIAQESFVDDAAVAQLKAVAALPGVRYVHSASIGPSLIAYTQAGSRNA